MQSVAGNVLRAEIDALSRLTGVLDMTIEPAVAIALNLGGKLIVTGMGKAGLIGQKISATLRSTGQPSAFLDPAQALHGDMGMIGQHDGLLALSNSGKTDELLHVMRYARRHLVPIITITGDPDSPMARMADLSIAYTLQGEGCPIGRAPMASAVAQLAIGDALAAELMVRRGFTEVDFLALHHGGYLGQSIRQTVALNAES
jgi:arabinose-5-phosphate isomerase